MCGVYLRRAPCCALRTDLVPGAAHEGCLRLACLPAFEGQALPLRQRSGGGRGFRCRAREAKGLMQELTRRAMGADVRHAALPCAEGTAYYENTIRGRVQQIKLGLLKLVFQKPSGKILGVHILGEDACELIHYGTALAQSGKTVRQVLGTTFAAGSFSPPFSPGAPGPCRWHRRRATCQPTPPPARR